jgi:hypothetical protein
VTGLEAAVAALAVYRLTLLVTADTVTEPWREQVIRRANERKHGPRSEVAEGSLAWDSWAATDPHWLAALVDCPWCASMWLAAPVTVASYWWAGTAAWWAVCGTLAGSAAAGYLATKASP